MTKIEKQIELLEWSWHSFNCLFTPDYNSYEKMPYFNDFAGNILYRNHEKFEKAYYFRQRSVLQPEITEALRSALYAKSEDRPDALLHAMNCQAHLDELNTKWREIECQHHDDKECPIHGSPLYEIVIYNKYHGLDKYLVCSVEECKYRYYYPVGG